MYSQRIINGNIEEYERLFKKKLVYHSYNDIQNFTKYIDSLIKIESNTKSSTITLARKLSRDRQKEVTEWIENEQALCALDAMYWATRYAWVCDEQGQIFKFIPRRSQEIYRSVIADFDEKQVSVELLILKGRQLGITTFTALLFLHRMLFFPNTQAIMASVKSSASELIGRIIDTAYNRCPWWLVPRRLPKRSFDNHSILSIQSGMQATGLAQGWTPTLIHVCLAPDVLIPVGDGLVKPIIDVVPGDLIVTSRGRQAKVRAVVQSPRMNEAACELSLWGNYSKMVVTRDHPILTPDGFVPAEEIEKGDFVRMPVRSVTSKIKSIGVPITPKGRVSKTRPARVPYKELILNRSFGWICGLYLSEGSIHVNTRLADRPADAIYFTIHQKEKDRTLAGIREALGIFQHINYNASKRSQTANCVVYDSGLARWMMANFGRGAEGKKIPDWVFDSGEEFIDGLLRGYYEGDGHIAKGSATVSCHSISFPMLLQIRSLLASRGYGWSALYMTPSGVHYGRNCRDQWMLNINGMYANKLRQAMGWPVIERTDYKLSLSDPRCSRAPKHWRYSEDGKFVDIQVFDNRVSFSETFYDLEVDAPEHDFSTLHCCVKNSEIADIPNPILTIEEGLFRAAHTSRNLFMVLEGTGRGNTGWLAETWRKSKEGYPKGVERLCPIFIPWVMCPEIYPKEDWLRKFPVGNGQLWSPHDITRKHIAKAESYIRNTPYLAKVAGANWKMPIEQQWFWQFNYDSACKNHTQKTWSSQMPADDFDSLTGVHDSVFDAEVLAELEENIYEVRTVGGASVKDRRVPVDTYAIIGHDVDEIFHPDPDIVDHSKEQIRVTWRSFRGQEYEWLMVPLKRQDEDVEMNTMDRLVVYEPPMRGNYYAMGVDTADGLGKEDEDRSVLSVTNNRFNGESDYQCLASGSFVTTDNGVKKIEDISIGDRVVNRLGQYTNVVAKASSLKEDSIMIYTGLSSNEPLHLTLDHKIAMSEGWVEAQDVKIGDWIKYPVRPLIDTNLPPVSIKGYKHNFSEQKEARKIRDLEFPLNRDFGFTCGLYLAEGCVIADRVGQYRGVSFTLHAREAAPWKEIIQRSMPTVHITNHKCKRANAHRLIVSSVKIAHWFNDAFGRTSEKHIPSWVWNAPREFVEGLVHGMLAGDGAIDKRCAAVCYCSVLPALVVGMRDLVLSLGWGLGCIRRHPRSIAQDIWIIYFYGDTAKRFHIEEMIRPMPFESTKRRPITFIWGWKKEWIYVKVRKIKPAGEGIFHDITVDGQDPSFCVMQAAVHNCCEYTTNKVNSAQIVPFAACIGAWYGKNSPDGRGMKYVIEQIRGPGDTCQHQLKMMGFNNHHKPRRYDSKKIKDNSGNKEGWYSSGWSVPMLMDRFREAVNGGWYIPRSKWLIEELRSLERHETAGKSKMEHRSGQHDDRVRAAAQSYFTAHDMDILTERAQKRSAPPAKRERPKGPGSANQMDVGSGW